VERELVMSGIGGQGVQLAATVLASAAFAEGREVQLFGSYGGMMRGGATEAAVVFASGPLEAPPTVATSWSVVLMHHEHSEHARSCLRPGSVLFVNSSVVEHEAPPDDVALVALPATDIAADAGNALAASLVMAGAYVAATGIVDLSSLTDAVGRSLPAYRAGHKALNERAVAAGAAAVGGPLVTAWPEEVDA
jgi:Pyruvate/2-oxoacid:ferredoxin oxidoreductase gamma subunit